MEIDSNVIVKLAVRVDRLEARLSEIEKKADIKPRQEYVPPKPDFPARKTSSNKMHEWGVKLNAMTEELAKSI